jgi:ketosteroid isomerase-like protein
VSLESVEVVVRGYRAFIDGDFEAIADLLDDDVEWYPLEGESEPQSFVDQADVLAVVAERYREQYRVELERCVGVGDQVVVGFRASRETRDADDPRPLQSRRKFSVERYYAVVTIRNGRVAEVRDFPHLDAAFAAAGIDPEEG